MRLAASIVASIALLLGGASCRTTELNKPWQTTDVLMPARRVLVIAMTRDEKLRLGTEAAMAKPLEKAGVEVRRGSEFSERGRDLTPEQLADVVRQVKPDAVLFTELRGVAERQRYEPGSASWQTYYAQTWRDYFHPGYYVSDLDVRVSTEFFSADPKVGLLWSTISEAFDPTSTNRGVGSASKAVASRLDKAGLI
jgi:hypothetical protein